MTILIAHRGGVGDLTLIEKTRRDLWGLFGSGFVGENTLQTIVSSLHSVDMIEIDLQESGSGELVVIHDVRIDRTTSGVGLVGEMTYDEIDDYFTRNGNHIPLLKSVLGAALPQKKILIDLKGIFDDEVLFRFFDSMYFCVFSDNIVVQSFDRDLLMRLRYRYPGMHLAVLSLLMTPLLVRFACAIDAYAVHVWSRPMYYLRDTRLYRLWFGGLLLKLETSAVRWGVWTVDDPGQKDFFVQENCWAIISNDISLMEKKGISR